MKRILALGIVLVIIAGGVVAYLFLKPPKEASGPIEAIPVAVEQPASADPTQAPDTAEPERSGESAHCCASFFAYRCNRLPLSALFHVSKTNSWLGKNDTTLDTPS